MRQRNDPMTMRHVVGAVVAGTLFLIGFYVLFVMAWAVMPC